MGALPPSSRVSRARRAAELSLEVTRTTPGRLDLGAALVIAIAIWRYVALVDAFWVERSSIYTLGREDRLWRDEVVARLTIAARR